MSGISLFSAVLLTGLLVACSLPVRNIPPLTRLALNPIETPQRRATPSGGTVIVDLPSTVRELDTYRIALKKNDRDWDYYAGAGWSNFLPIVVRDDVAKTLQQTRLFKSVVTDKTGQAGDRILKIEIQSFQAEYGAVSAMPVARVRMSVSLVGYLQQAQLASFTVSASAKVAANNLSAIQSAFAAAFSDAQRQIVRKLGAAHK